MTHLNGRPWSGGASLDPGPGIDPVSLMLGQLHTGQAIILDRLDRQDHVLDRIDERLQAGTEVHHTLDKRVTALERQPEAPRAEAWIKQALAVALPVATLWLTGSLEQAGKVLEMVLKGMGGH